MLINLKRFGRLGNRLFLAAHLIAFSRKFNVPVLNLAFQEYASLFPWFQGNQAVGYPWSPTGDVRAARRLRVYHNVRSFLPGVRRWTYWGDRDWDFDKEVPQKLVDNLLAGKDVYFSSWLFRGPASLASSRDEVLKIFAPQPEVLQAVDRFFSTASDQRVTTVGVHVRWEDYRNTTYFLTAEQYRAAMERMASLLGKPCRFVLFSNEVVPEPSFLGLDFQTSPGSSPVFDLYAMSRCDYLMAPPSTFSGWASYYGSVPLLRLEANRLTWTLNDFEVIKS